MQVWRKTKIWIINSRAKPFGWYSIYNDTIIWIIVATLLLNWYKNRTKNEYFAGGFVKHSILRYLKKDPSNSSNLHEK